MRFAAVADGTLGGQTGTPGQEWGAVLSAESLPRNDKGLAEANPLFCMVATPGLEPGTSAL